jgi:hypothetical protein
MMKRPLILLFALLSFGIACSLGGSGGTGAQVENLLNDPQIGLDLLSDFQADLTITFSGKQNAQTVDTTETYTQSEWPALGAQFTAYETTDKNLQPPYFLSGDVGEAHYNQSEKTGACSVYWGAAAGGSTQFRLASFLGAVGAAHSEELETIEGVSARRYSFDGASLGLAGEDSASGQVWIAEKGGYVVKYSLQVTGKDTYFGEGLEGTQRIEYLLSKIGTRPKVVYPSGCEPVLTGIPAMEDATGVVRLPNLLTYSSKSSLDAINAFYSDFFKSDGWEEAAVFLFGDERTLTVYTRANSSELTMVAVVKGDTAQQVTVNLFGPESETTPSEPLPTVEGGQAPNPGLRVISGLGILLGMDSSQPAPPSFHLEAYNRKPAWEAGGVVLYEDRMTADVQGVNVHFTSLITAPDGTMTRDEAYLIGDTEYDVKEGKLQPPGPGSAKLAWVLWPLDPVAVFGVASGGATAAGTELVDGRMAEIYAIDAGGEMGGAAGAELSITAVTGRVWIDQETGALLKAELDYQADVKDADGKVMGNAAGRLEITVTQVGKVTVALPAQ